MDQNWYIDDDMNAKQLSKFFHAEDGHKRKYMQKSGRGEFLIHPVHARVHLKCEQYCCFQPVWWKLTYTRDVCVRPNHHARSHARMYAHTHARMHACPHARMQNCRLLHEGNLHTCFLKMRWNTPFQQENFISFWIPCLQTLPLARESTPLPVLSTHVCWTWWQPCTEHVCVWCRNVEVVFVIDTLQTMSSSLPLNIGITTLLCHANYTRSPSPAVHVMLHCLPVADECLIKVQLLWTFSFDFLTLNLKWFFIMTLF